LTRLTNQTARRQAVKLLIVPKAQVHQQQRPGRQDRFGPLPKALIMGGAVRLIPQVLGQAGGDIEQPGHAPGQDRPLARPQQPRLPHQGIERGTIEAEHGREVRPGPGQHGRQGIQAGGGAGLQDRQQLVQHRFEQRRGQGA